MKQQPPKKPRDRNESRAYRSRAGKAEVSNEARDYESAVRRMERKYPHMRKSNG